MNKNGKGINDETQNILFLLFHLDERKLLYNRVHGITRS